jgi:hypothetical protein
MHEVASGRGNAESRMLPKLHKLTTSTRLLSVAKHHTTTTRHQLHVAHNRYPTEAFSARCAIMKRGRRTGIVDPYQKWVHATYRSLVRDVIKSDNSGLNISQITISGLNPLKSRFVTANSRTLRSNRAQWSLSGSSKSDCHSASCQVKTSQKDSHEGQ